MNTYEVNYEYSLCDTFLSFLKVYKIVSQIDMCPTSQKIAMPHFKVDWLRLCKRNTNEVRIYALFLRVITCSKASENKINFQIGLG